ncbi:MAG: VWA domain-containing protein [Acidobacteriaceae bacterium]|nr:VWA domain-containing protein [Acidobacteriaceae bacterium]
MRRLSNSVVSRRSAVMGTAATLLLASALCVFAQFRSDTRLVVLHASVTDRKGKLITNLDRNAFRVFENGQPQDVKIFRREDVPVSLGILVDDSGSMSEKLPRVAAAARAMVEASNPQDEVFIVNFNDEAYLDVPFTNDINKMQQGLDRIDARGGTAMRDAIDMSITYMKKQAKMDKKVLMVITDGNDNASTATLEQVVQRADKTDTLVYAIGLFSEEEKHEASKARRALNELTTATGGLALYPKDVNDVKAQALEIAHDIRNQYTIAYTPHMQALDGTYRQIKVTVNAPGKPSVRTRSGYYATPDSQTKTTAALARPAQP